MNELQIKLLFGLLRHVATPLVLWLNERNILSEDDVLEFLLVIATFAAAYGTSVWNKVNALRERNTAAAMAPSTPTEVKVAVAAGNSAPAISPDNVVPIITKTSVVLLMVATMALAGCASIQKIPPVPTTIAGADQDVRSGGIKALGILGAAGKVADRASQIETQLATDGVVPAAMHSQIQAGFKAVATVALSAINAIERGAITSWVQLKAAIDPVLERVNALIGLVQSVGGGLSRVREWLGTVVEIVTSIFVPQTNFGGAR